MMITRRQFVGGLGAASAALVLGFDPSRRCWVSAGDLVGAAGSDACSFEGAPVLAGTLLVDDMSRQAVSTDKGNWVTHTPCAVLRPGNVDDIAKMIRYCGGHRIPVATRGQAHSTHGQGLSDGLLIENQALHQIHSIGPTSAVVDTGVTWMALVRAAYDRKLTPPTLTGYAQLTVGGTLSMGGIGGLVGGKNSGLQVDHVRELEVVTGRGDVVTCSESSLPDLFESVLAGLGQYGVMTQATIDLVAARDRARTYQLHYPTPQLDIMFHDFRTLLDRPDVDHVYVLWFPPGTSDLAQINATVFYDVDVPGGGLPNDVELMGGLSTAPVVQDTTYLDYVFAVDTLVDTFEATIGWSRLPKPWFDVWLTDSTIEPFVNDVIPTLAYDDIGAAGFMLTFATRRSLVTRPNLSLPQPDGSAWVFLFDILTVAENEDPGGAWRSEKLERNDRLFALARDAYGGVRYPIGTMTFSADDWRRHYGSRWPTVLARRKKFDPSGIMTPGPGIFA
jgi:FAD/FMN-containing dehydrogenase